MADTDARITRLLDRLEDPTLSDRQRSSLERELERLGGRPEVMQS